MRSPRAFSLVIAAVALSLPVDSLRGQAPGLADRSAGVQTDAGSSVVVGRVLDAGTGQPVIGAIVSLGGTALPGIPVAAIQLVAVGILPASMAPGEAVMTDARGTFVFRQVASGRANLTVRAAGYLPGAFGQNRPGGSIRSLQVAGSETLTDVEVRLWKAGAIGGTIFDEGGEPVVEVPVRALRRSVVQGREKFVAAAASRTDDRGMYRIGSLEPGEYLIVMPSSVTSIPVAIADAYLSAVSSPDPASRSLLSDVSRTGTAAAAGGVAVGDQRIQTDYGRALAPSPRTADDFAVYPIAFHPAAFSPQQAAVVAVGSGEERTGIDLHTGLVRTYRISGTVTGPEGPSAHASVRLVPAFTRELSSDSGFTASTTSTDAQGRFTILGATPGEYVIRALRAGSSMGGSAAVVRAGDGTFMVLGGESAPVPPGGGARGSEPLTGEAAVSVAGTHLDGVSITLQGGARLAGRVEFTGSTPAPGPADLSRIFLSVTRRDGTSVRAQQTRATPEGTFNTAPYPPGEYMMYASPPPGWHLRSVLVDGREMLDRVFDLSRDLEGIVLRFVDRPAGIDGRVTGSRPGSVAAAAVSIFPADHEEWVASGMSPRRARLVDAAPDGSFELPGLVPGDYMLAAVPADTPIELQDPEVIAALARIATRVTLGEAEQRTLTLAMSSIR